MPSESQSNQTTSRTIGVLTSGGDCAGLNAVIRAVVSRAIQSYGWRVIGINDGTHGLLERPLRYEELNLGLFTGNILRLGGTILGTTNKGDPFAFPMPDGSTQDRSAEFVAGYQELGLSGLIGIGGDGSIDILHRLTDGKGIDFIAVPKTIDNDVPLTELSVGFSTAVSCAVEASDRLQPTAASHERVMILQVMGRDAGHIALNAGLAGGADVILIPEIPFSMDRVAERLESLIESGRNHALVVCAEAARPENGEVAERIGVRAGEGYAGIGQYLAEQISGATGAETRVTVLGHVQRGGIPSSQDRNLASAFGVRAVDLLAEGASGRMVAWQHREVVDVAIGDVVREKRPVDVDDALVKTARGLNIGFGD